MKYEFRGKTIKDAIRKGLKKLSLDSKDVEITILDEGKRGLFSLDGEHLAAVMITPKISQSEPINYPAVQNLIKKTLAEILNKTPFSAGKINSTMIISRIYVNVISKSEPNYESIAAFEIILNEIINKNRDAKVKIHLDFNLAVKKMEERLFEEAVILARRVKEKRVPYSFDKPMGFFLRKVIHDAVRKVEGVTSVSEGEGSEKIVKIILKE